MSIETKTTRIYSDLDLDFSKHPVTKDVSRKTNDSAVIASVKNLLQTNYYERPFNPTFGGNITALLFEPVDPISASILQKEIEMTIENYEKRARIDQIIVDVDPENQRYLVNLRFYILNSTKPVTVNLYLNRLR